jgi:hypothetical protein
MLGWTHGRGEEGEVGASKVCATVRVSGDGHHVGVVSGRVCERGRGETRAKARCARSGCDGEGGW